MNFLAHCVLARSHPDLIIGGFLGDFIKGSVPDLPGQISDGVRLHRRLDAYSAEQPHIHCSVTRLPPSLRRVAPVFIDLVADHLLARRFEQEEDQPLRDFTRDVYQTLDAARAHYPQRAAQFLDVIRDHDLLAGYAETVVIQRAFERIAVRLKLTDIVAPAMAALDADYDGFEADFAAYYPDLKRHTATWLASRPTQATG